MARFKPLISLPATLGGWTLFLAFFARLLSPVTADLSFIILAVYAFKGRSQAIQALSLSWFFVMLNPGFAPDASYATIGRYLVLFSAALSVAMRKKPFKGSRYEQQFIFLTILLGMFFVVHAFIFSPMPDVSILKAMSWALVMVTLIAAWSGLGPDQSVALERWLMGFLLLIMVSSLPFVLIPSIGYLRNGSGFQGVLNHPQAFGLVMALFGALLFGGLLAQKRPSRNAIALVLVCFGLIMMSKTRTAGLAFVLGTVLGVASLLLLSRTSLKFVAPALLSRRVQMLAFGGLVVAITLGSQLKAASSQFLTKGGAAEGASLGELYDDSRGILIVPMLQNIEAQPFTGIGFGVASQSYFMQVKRDPMLGLPISASIEKGVMPLAVLEEVGIPGFILVCIWIFLLLRRAATGGVATLCVAIVALLLLLLNMGESVLFSPGGMGMLLLIMLAWAAAKPLEQRAVYSGFSANA